MPLAVTPGSKLQSLRYFAVDDGCVTNRLAALAGCDPRVRPADSPRHAQLLVVNDPIPEKLVPPLMELAALLPGPASVLCFTRALREAGLPSRGTRAEDLFPGVKKVEWHGAPAAVAAALEGARVAVTRDPSREPETLDIESRGRELETEDVVLSLGPVQPFTAGPLRVWLVCDGEQVVDARVDAGFAKRGIDGAMRAAAWKELPDLAAQVDPLAPACGNLACVRGIEMLAQWQPDTHILRAREGAVALARAVDHAWWLVRFTALLEAPRLLHRARDIAEALEQTAISAGSTQWIMLWGMPARPVAASDLHALEADVRKLHHTVQGDRLLALRVRGIGHLDAESVRQAGVTGPVLDASVNGTGDVSDRVLARIARTAHGIGVAANAFQAARNDAPAIEAPWPLRAGRAHVTVEGPRGELELMLESNGGTSPVSIEWRRPSRALLALVPRLLRGQKLADAQIVLASLDIATAEADG